MPRIEGTIYSCDICGRKWSSKKEAETCEKLHPLMQEIDENVRKLEKYIKEKLGRNAIVKVDRYGKARIECEAVNKHNLPHEIIITETNSKITPKIAPNSDWCGREEMVLYN